MDVAATDLAYQRPMRRWKPERCDRIALVLQGGGALGAYQAGVFQALSEADIEPDWITGVSIGAINSAIIAGNSKQWRLKRLRTFWERITERKIWNYTPDGDVFRKARNAASSWMTLIEVVASRDVTFSNKNRASLAGKDGFSGISLFMVTSPV